MYTKHKKTEPFWVLSFFYLNCKDNYGHIWAASLACYIILCYSIYTGGVRVKRFIKVICIVVLTVLLLTSLTECSLMYGDKIIELDKLRYYTHNVFRTCFAGDYTWPSDANYAVLNIPDTCDGYRVTALGGYIGSGGPCPFSINMSGVSVVYSEGTIPKNAQIEQYHLVINIGKNLREDTFIIMDDYYCIGENRFVQILVSVNCSEENQHFYSEEGKLFRKTDHSLVDGFFYYSDNSG